MNEDESDEILELHKKWLDDEEEGGVRADLRRADLDYSCFPLWGGGKGVKLDRRLFLQLVAHICAVDVDDDCKMTQKDLMPLAIQSHVAEFLLGDDE